MFDTQFVQQIGGYFLFATGDEHLMTITTQQLYRLVKEMHMGRMPDINKNLHLPSVLW